FNNELHINLLNENDSNKYITSSIIKGFSKTFFNTTYLSISKNWNIKNIIYKFNEYDYDKCTFWEGIKEIGDNFVTGTKLNFHNVITWYIKNNSLELYVVNE